MFLQLGLEVAETFHLIFHLLGIARFSSAFQVKAGLKIDGVHHEFAVHYLHLAVFGGSGAKPEYLTRCKQ